MQVRCFVVIVDDVNVAVFVVPVSVVAVDVVAVVLLFPPFDTVDFEVKDPFLFARDRLVGLVVRCPPRERKVPGSNPACAGIFSGSSHTSDSKIGTPVATLPGARCYRVSAGTGRPGVSIL